MKKRPEPNAQPAATANPGDDSEGSPQTIYRVVKWIEIK